MIPDSAPKGNDLTGPSVNPYITLCTNVLPMFAEDANEMVVRIIDHAKSTGKEIDIEDGFDIYRQLSRIRRLFADTVPEYGSCHTT